MINYFIWDHDVLVLRMSFTASSFSSSWQQCVRHSLSSSSSSAKSVTVSISGENPTICSIEAPFLLVSCRAYVIGWRRISLPLCWRCVNVYLPSGVYAMWNLYVFGLLVLYAPSNKRFLADDADEGLWYKYFISYHICPVQTQTDRFEWCETVSLLLCRSKQQWRAGAAELGSQRCSSCSRAIGSLGPGWLHSKSICRLKGCALTIHHCLPATACKVKNTWQAFFVLEIILFYWYLFDFIVQLLLSDVSTF